MSATDFTALEPERGTVAWAKAVLAEKVADVRDLYRGDRLDAAAILFREMPPDLDEVITAYPLFDGKAYRRVVKAHATAMKRRPVSKKGTVRENHSVTAINERLANEVVIAEVEPAIEPINTETLLEEIIETLRLYVWLQPHEYVVVALWIMHTWVRDLYAVVPYLALTSVLPNCGKSTVIEILSILCFKAHVVSNISGPAIFRLVDGYEPTLLLDECDTYVTPTKDNSDLRGILNSGTTRRTGFVTRCVSVQGEGGRTEWKLARFKTFGPKALGLIGDMPAPLRTRSIHIRMTRIAVEDKGSVEKLTEARMVELINSGLVAKLARWSRDEMENLLAVDFEMPTEFAARTEDNWTPLFAIASLAGPQYFADAVVAARKLDALDADDTNTLRVRLLSDIRTIFAREGKDRFSSMDLSRLLAADEDGPWCEFGKRKKPVSPSDLAYMLKQYPVIPHQIRLETSTDKVDVRSNGYMLEDFAHAFKHYLKAAQQIEAKPKAPPSGATLEKMIAVRDRATAERALEEAAQIEQWTLPMEQALAIARHRVEGCDRCDWDKWQPQAVGSQATTHDGSPYCEGGTHARGPDINKPIPGSQSISAGGNKAHCDCRACGLLKGALKQAATESASDDSFLDFKAQ